MTGFELWKLDQAARLTAPANDSDLAGEELIGAPELTLYQQVCDASCTATLRLTRNTTSGFVHLFNQELRVRHLLRRGP